MPFKKIPLRQLVEQHMSWSEFVRIADKPKKDRPSFRSMSIIYGPDGRTIKSWLTRWDRGERN